MQYILIRIYDDGTIIEGKKLYCECDIESLACLIHPLKTITYEFAIALCEE